MQIIIALFLAIFLFANDNNLTDTNNTKLSQEIKTISHTLSTNEFYLSYQSYLNYKKLEEEYKKYKRLARYHSKYREKLLSIKTELDLLKDNQNIFKTLIKLKNLPKPPEINNPFAIFNGINYEKELKTILKQNQENYNQFLNTLDALIKLQNLYKKMHKKNKTLEKIINDFQTISNVYQTKLKTIKNQAEIYRQNVKSDIQKEINKLIYLAISIVISILIFTFIKIIARKYVKEESIYLINKILNFINITIIILIISFFYINNATYLITILGFASAGIAIAMKDWFMNLFGWFVIMTSGNFKVGDRIKIYLQNGQVKIVGDVIDITMTRIVIYEQVTYTTYLHNRRAGRVIFVPNNVIFTNPIFNYTHNGLATVWDGIDVTITFDSNYKKAAEIVKEIANQYSKRYKDATKRRLQKLKAVYQIKNINTEPRVFTFISENGVTISCWYMDYYSPLKIRSDISAEILDAFAKEDDITIAYPTYKINLKSEENEKFTQA